jgi:methionyl-tRNA formyltransferase
MRLAFMGTPDFAVPALINLIDEGHEVVCVYTQPPKPSGRGQKINKTPIHRLAEEHNIEVRTPKSLKSSEAQEAFAALNVDAAIVAAYGLILPKKILEAPKFGCINIHASLLPRWRGAAPIHRALLAGDKKTGITIMQMDEGLDTGPMISQAKVAITPQMTAADLHDTLSLLGGKLLIETLNQNQILARSQPEVGVTYAHKISKAESEIDWTKPANQIERKIRAFTPWPGTFFCYGDDKIRILAAEVIKNAISVTPGQVCDDGLTISCGEGALRLLKLQRPGKKPMQIDEFLRGFEIKSGSNVICNGTL